LDIRLLGLHRYILDPGGFGTAQSNIMDIAILELVSVDDRQGMGVTGVIVSVVAIIEVIVPDNTGVVVPAERAPAAVVIAPVPVHPGRTPVILGDPIPTQAEPPAPAAVMVD
jgi:hypothetical protein